MAVNTPIAIHVVGRPQFDVAEFLAFLTGFRTNWKRTPDVEPAEELIEAAGRVCYMAFGSNQSDRDNQEYIRHLIKMGHESVLEHVNWSFVIVGISRSLSHQIVRHRVGFAFSQLSQQYHEETEAEFRMPVELHGNARAEAAWERAVGVAKEAYLEILRAIDQPADPLHEHLVPREFKRAVRSAARSVLPSATETVLFMTANARALRHFFAVRGSTPGDREMRDFSVALFRAVSPEAPGVFFDFQLAPLGDGSEMVLSRPGEGEQQNES